MPFKNIRGQSRPLAIIQRMLVSDKIPHGFLFCGTAGVGKHASALALAQALNCTNTKDDFCGSCASCNKTATGMHPDVIQIAPEKNIIKIDQIRTLQQNIVYAPIEGSWRIIIINQAECMNKEAANCLLKTLEEPPAATMLILVANSTSRLLPTIMSRCQKIVFNPLQEHDIETVLCEEGIAAEQAHAVACHAHGSLQRAHQLLDSSLFEDLERLTASMTDQYTIEQTLELAAVLSKSPDRVTALLILLLEWLRDVHMYRFGAQTKHLFNAARSDSIHLAAEQITPCRLETKTKQILRLMSAHNQNINMQLGLESLLLT